MSVDGAWDAERDAPARAQDASRAPGLDRAPSADAPSPHADADLAPEAERVPGADRAGDLRAENVRLGRALGELSTENAELYKRVGQLEAELKTEKARHAAWSREMDRRQDSWAVREDVLNGRLESQAAVMGQLARRVAELERPATERPGALPDRFERPGSFAGEKVEQRRRPAVSNEFIGVGIALGGGVLTGVGDWLGSTPAAVATGLTVSALGIVGAGIPWLRKLREDRNADRPQG